MNTLTLYTKTDLKKEQECESSKIKGLYFQNVFYNIIFHSILKLKH